MYNYFLNKDAKEDLHRIYQCGVKTFGEIQAEYYYDLLLEEFKRIASNPFIFPDYQYKNYRYCVCKSNTIYFKLENDEVEIIAIIGKQNFENRTL